MKFISWNVNGIENALENNFVNIFKSKDAGVFCIQNIKNEVDFDLPGYHQFWNPSKNDDGYGTAVFMKEKPKKVAYGLGIEEFDQEGRIITIDFDLIYIVNCIAPETKLPIEKRAKWDLALKDYLRKLDQNKAVIICGNFNDTYNDLETTFTDTVKHYHPDYDLRHQKNKILTSKVLERWLIGADLEDTSENNRLVVMDIM